MAGRISLGLLATLLTFVVPGCVTTQTPAPGAGPGGEKIAGTNGMTTIKSDDNPWPIKPKGKRDPLSATEIAFGKMKETEADSPQYKNMPEAQARLRDEARKAYQKAIELDKDSIQALRHLGRLYVKMNDTDRALDTYKKALAKHGNDGALWYDIGLCHTRRKDFAESMRCFNKALELDPENRDYQKMLGITLAWTGQVEKGLSQLLRAQGPALAHLTIARVMQQKDQIESAKQHLRQALNINAEFEDARILLAQLEQPLAAASPARALQGPQ